MMLEEILMMSLQMLLNKRLRENYRCAISVRTKEECDSFFNTLNKHDKDELIAYIECWDIPERKHRAAPINKYVLLHYREYLTEEEIRNTRKVGFVNLWVFIISICAACIITYLHMT